MTTAHWSTTYVPRARLKLEQWPAIDRARWAAAMIPDDPFRPGGVAAKWPHPAQRHVQHCYGRWLFWLDVRGDLDPTLTPGKRVNDDCLNEYLRDLQTTKSAFTVQNQIQALGMALHSSTSGAFRTYSELSHRYSGFCWKSSKLLFAGAKCSNGGAQGRN